jgi:hypothetical protein
MRAEECLEFAKLLSVLVFEETLRFALKQLASEFGRFDIVNQATRRCGHRRSEVEFIPEKATRWRVRTRLAKRRFEKRCQQRQRGDNRCAKRMQPINKLTPSSEVARATLRVQGVHRNEHAPATRTIGIGVAFRRRGNDKRFGGVNGKHVVPDREARKVNPARFDFEIVLLARFAFQNAVRHFLRLQTNWTQSSIPRDVDWLKNRRRCLRPEAFKHGTEHFR